MRTETSGTEERIGKRTIRAATESMVVTPAGRGTFDVYNAEGRRYGVSLLEETCTCPDYERRGASLPNGCKHLIRVRQEAGLEEIPDLGPRRLDVEIARDVRARRSASAPVAMADGGRVLPPETRGESGENGTPGRPEECDCLSTMDSEGLGCFPCYLAGFRTANPNPPEA